LAGADPALHEAKIAGADEVPWGHRYAVAEFIHADDLADACLTISILTTGTSPINVGHRCRPADPWLAVTWRR